MTMNTKTLRSPTSGLFLSLCVALLVGLVAGPMGCTGKETGIPQRHIHGVLTLPPLGLWEKETAPKSEDASLNNDTLESADGPYSISYAYHRIRGTADSTCADISPGETETDCSGGFFGTPADEDWFRITANYFGPIVFKGVVVSDSPDSDVDIAVMDATGNELFSDSNESVADVDDEGNAVLDDEGVAVQVIADPRFATEVTPGTEFNVRVTVNGGDDAVDYDLIVVGNDPRLHLAESGIEGDQATFEADLLYPTVTDSLELLVGAYTSDDIDALGNPVGGTSCESWELDEDTDTFWCAWDMHFVQQVSIESNVLIDGMGDGKDNDCDGTADTGTETRDEDGDGYSILDGDCNDGDVDVHPFRGDTAGDRKDNDCDGWADNGPDDVDNDGDGHCENGRDLDGDGVCRGQLETRLGMDASMGDCNDTDPNIYPGLGNEIVWNSLDDDCNGGDAPLNFTVNFDGDRGTIEGLTPHEWGDLEEIACGTNPYDPDDTPVDADGDGVCDSDCLGEVGCPQDTDGDGFHNWEELNCGSDSEVPDAAMPDFDGDGTCDGEDSDADGDGFTRAMESDSEADALTKDCHDKDPTIHPHLRDETGQLLDGGFNYDVVDGINNDCDGLIDENRDWIRAEDGTFTQDPSYESEDQDGDGYSLALRDCDDNDPDMHLGNYEVRTANVLSTDFNTVFLFAGQVSSLNSTAEAPDARRVTELVPYDLEKERVAWEFEGDWAEGDPPVLRPTALPELSAWYAMQPEVGYVWYESEEPNDCDIDAASYDVESPPMAEGHFQELGEAAKAGTTNEIRGSIETIEQGSWGGDNDTYHVTFPEGGELLASLDWDTAGGDYDAIVFCWYFDAANAPAYYTFGGMQTTDLSKPEEGTTGIPLPAGSDCYVVIMGYSGLPGNYTMKLTALEEE